ncbi:hypothetical protein ACLBXM_04980 [Xanthobacteraceae bacterium A53D]
MKAIITAAALIALSAPAWAESCTVTADTKKLAGAARTSFLTKCERDAASNCDTMAGQKKLAGAAKTSYVGKCVKDAVGAPAN